LRFEIFNFMQYQIPQFIDIEDRIIGPLTLKQFMYLAAAAAIILISWFLFTFWFWFLTSIPVAAFALALAFLKVNGRPFIFFIFSFFAYIFRPRLYVWTQKRGETEKPEAQITAPVAEEKPAPQEEKVSRSRLRELALNLDVAAKRKTNQE